MAFGRRIGRGSVFGKAAAPNRQQQLMQQTQAAAPNRQQQLMQQAQLNRASQMQAVRGQDSTAAQKQNLAQMAGAASKNLQQARQQPTQRAQPLAPQAAPAQKPVSNREKAMNFLNTLKATKDMSGIDRARALKAGMAKGGVVMANCGASVKPSQKGKK